MTRKNQEKTLTPDNQRLILACEKLISNGYAKSFAEIAKKCGKTSQYFTDIKSGKGRYSRKFLDSLKEEYPISLNYILAGIDPPLEARILKTKEPKERLLQKGVPYFDIDIAASIKESFQDVVEVPEFYVDFKPFNDCTAYLPIWGDSMFPAYASGEIVAVKKIDNPSIILWGEAYLVITNAIANNMKTVKLLYPHDDEDKIILRASNPNFRGDTVIPKDSIINLYAIKGKITRKQL